MNKLISTSDVVSVYCGKVGACCCGCSGKHHYAKKYQALGSKRRGYAVNDEDVNDRYVTKVVAVLNRLSAQATMTRFGDEYSVAAEEGDKVYIAYLV